MCDGCGIVIEKEDFDTNNYFRTSNYHIRGGYHMFCGVCMEALTDASNQLMSGHIFFLDV